MKHRRRRILFSVLIPKGGGGSIARDVSFSYLSDNLYTFNYIYIYTIFFIDFSRRVIFNTFCI